MKDNRPIAQQVAELTEAQKQKIPKIFKTHLLVTILLLALFITVPFVSLRIAANSAYKDWQLMNATIETRQRLSESTGSISYDADLYGERDDAMDKYYDLLQMGNISIVIGAAAGAVSALVLQLYISKKYPYYSEKRYFYLRKLK